MWQVSFFICLLKYECQYLQTGIQGIGKVNSWLDCSIASPVGVQKRLYNGSFQNKFKSHFLPADFLFCASLCLVERKGNMCRNTYNKYVFSMNEKGSPRSTYQPSVGVQKAFRAEETIARVAVYFEGRISEHERLLFFTRLHTALVTSTFLPRHVLYKALFKHECGISDSLGYQEAWAINRYFS